LSCLTSTQIWLIPVWDNSQSTYFTKLKKEKEEKSWKSSTNLSPFAKSFLGCSHMTQHKKFEIKILGQEIKEDNKNSWAQ
jgi:hypothetical protein